MNDLKLNRKDGVFILICLIVLVLGVWVGINYFHAAFPESSIDFRYDRAGSKEIAARFWKDFGLEPPKDYRHASRFGFDGNAKTYLEKELGVEGAQKYFGHPVRLWYWQHRWFKPSTKEEFKVFVTPEGDIVRVSHEIEEAAEGADLSEDSARFLAERFLFGTMQQSAERLTFIESRRMGRPHRADWTFTWRATGIEPVKGSEYRYEVGVLGDRIGDYREYLHVPEAWQASYRKLRSYNEAASNFDGIGFALTIIAMVAVFFLRSRRRDIKWRTALGFGIVMFGLMVLNQLNDFTSSLYWYDTTASWSGFLTQELLLGLLSALGAGAMIFFLTAAAEPLYRERYGDKLALSRMFSARALRTKSAFKSILLGITLTSFFFAYQIVFYLVAGKFGAWSPSDVPYDDLLNTAMPWAAVLMIGFLPAVSEEFMSRMFSIPFLQKAFRNRFTWLALLIPAVIWGFGHSAYPNQPFWIRGAEVGIAGILIGFVMLRWGILACLVWHYTVDALYTALLLFRSSNPYYVATAAVATGLLVVPLLIAFIAYLRKGEFAPEAGLRNAEDNAPVVEAAPVVAEVPPVPVSTVLSYQPLPTRNRIVAAMLLVFGVVAALIPVSKLGEFLEYPVPKEQAIRTFADSLRSGGWADPDTLKIAAFVYEREGADLRDIYLLKQLGSIEKFNAVANERLGYGRWWINAWQPENRRKFLGSVHARSGAIEGLFPRFPEEMPGDSLTKDSARAMVEALYAARKLDLSAFELREHLENARPHRLDHSLTFEAKDGDPRNIGDAHLRYSADVQGNVLSAASRPWYKAPEEWRREYTATTALRAVLSGASLVAIVGAVVWAVMLVVNRTRKGLVPWKKALLIAIVPAGVSLIGALNEFYLAQFEYFNSVEIPWGVFRATTIVSWVLSGVMAYVLFALGFAFLGGLYPEKLALLRRHERRAALTDALYAVSGGIGLWLLARSAGYWLSAWKPEWIRFDGWDVPGWFAAPTPFSVIITLSIIAAMVLAAMLGFFHHLWQGPLRKPWGRALIILGAAAMLAPTERILPMEWVMAAAKNVIVFAAGYVFLRFVVVGRPVSLFAATLAIGAAPLVLGGLGSGNSEIILHTWIAAAVLLVGLLWWLGLFARHRA